MIATPTLDSLIKAIRVRQAERAAEGLAPLEELHLPTETYHRLLDEGRAITGGTMETIYTARFTKTMTVYGVWIRPI